MRVLVRPLSTQTPGGFDNGRIEERRPVMFARSGEHAERFGPLFYWAWAWSDRGGDIAEHPHEGFEIVSYVLQGRMEHRDSLGSWKHLDAGSMQVMQTNGGVSHSERFAEGMRTDMFQIWFEPDLRETIALPASYRDLKAGEFSTIAIGNHRMKHLIGEGAPVRLRTDATMHDIELAPERPLTLARSNAHAVVVVTEGKGTLNADASHPLTVGDAAIVTLGENESFSITGTTTPFRYVQIIVPATVHYPLYPNC
jgi:redox-sensitive bicupin YhaK (pirin superfamily)